MSHEIKETLAFCFIPFDMMKQAVREKQNLFVIRGPLDVSVEQFIRLEVVDPERRGPDSKTWARIYFLTNPKELAPLQKLMRSRKSGKTTKVRQVRVK